jgi:hypothetical protein
VCRNLRRRKEERRRGESKKRREGAENRKRRETERSLSLILFGSFQPDELIRLRARRNVLCRYVRDIGAMCRALLALTGRSMKGRLFKVALFMVALKGRLFKAAMCRTLLDRGAQVEVGSGWGRAVCQVQAVEIAPGVPHYGKT